MEGSSQPPIFSSDGCYVQVKINHEDKVAVGTSEVTASEYHVSIKGTHDTNPEALTNIVYQTLAQVFGSPPITMPYAVVSGLIEFSWSGRTNTNEETIFSVLSKSISSSKIRSKVSSFRQDIPEEPSIRRKGPFIPHDLFPIKSADDGRVMWRCVKGDGQWETREEASASSCQG